MQLRKIMRYYGDFLSGSVVKNLPANAGYTGDAGSIPGSGRSPEGESGNPLDYSSLKKKSHGQRSLESYNLWDRKESDTTEL